MTEFHLLRPAWLLVLLIIPLLIWWWRHPAQQSGWRQLLPNHLAALLLRDQNQQRQRRTWPLLMALAIASVSLAGPSWERIPQPVYQLDNGQVIVVDMSLSMRSTDLAPDRLAQLQFKAMALVNQHLDGETGLVAYAGDAYVISPLTSDGRNISNLLRALSPELMPEYGSAPLPALGLAQRLLQESGYPTGDIYWFTDGIQSADYTELADYLRQQPNRVSILAFGTSAGAPIKQADGSLLRDAKGDLVIPRLDTQLLQQLATLSGGQLSVWQADGSDLLQLTAAGPRQRESKAQADQQGGDQWLDRGPWLWLLVLLLVLPAARRGVLSVALIAMLLWPLIDVPPAAAEPTRWSQQLWQTPYQQAHEALQQGDYEQAQQLAEDPWQRATANYRAGNYQQALADFATDSSAIGWYNQANSWMHLGDYQQAISAYQQALASRPDWLEAQQNLALAKQLLQQQQSEQQQSPQQSDQQSEQQQSEQQSQQQQSEQQQSDQQSEQPAEQQQSQQSAEQQAEQQQSEQPAEQQAEQQQSEQQQAEQRQQQLSDEQRQQLEQWLNRIDDDPALLLRNKMRLEAQQRRQQRPPTGVQQQW